MCCFVFVGCWLLVVVCWFKCLWFVLGDVRCCSLLSLGCWLLVVGRWLLFAFFVVLYCCLCVYGVA